MRLARWLAALALVIAAPAFAQSVPLQGGPWASGHAPMYSNSGGSQPVIVDSGTSAGGAAGVGLSELGITARGTGAPPYVGQGHGPNGENFCNYDAPITNPTGYHVLCVSPNALGGGLISYSAGGGAADLPLSISVNGSTYLFPFVTGGIIGPATTVVGDIALWNNTTGTLLKDVAVLPAANGGAGTVTGALKANGSGLVTQAACADLSNGATGCSTATGTTGATIPLNNGGFTQSGTANFTGAFQKGGNVMTFPGTAATLARTDTGQTFTGAQTFSTPIASTSVATMTSTVGGGVPTPPNDTSKFLNGAGAFTTPNAGSVDNFLPNVNWQLWAGIGYITKQNSSGTAAQSAVSCSGFQTVNAAPIFTCANTGQVKVGDLMTTSTVAFWGYAGAGYITCASVQCNGGKVTASRVIAVTPNVSIRLQGNFGGVSPVASTAITLTPISPGDAGTGATAAADGWLKTGSLIATVDDFAADAYPGAIRPLLLRKGITGTENFQWTVPVNQLSRFQGQTVTCGVAVWQRVQGGANTWNVYISDNINPGGTSTAGTGVSYGGYQFISVTHTIGQTATAIQMGITTTGNSGDVFNVALPTCYFGSGMVQSQLHQNSRELIRATNHWNPPLLTPLIIDFPSVEIIGGSSLYGWNNIDMEAISFGTMHNSISNVYAKVEWQTSTVGAYIFTGTNVNVSHLSFGPQAITTVAGINNVSVALWPLYYDGTGSIWSATVSLSSVLGTFDFWDVDTTMPTAVH